MGINWNKINAHSISKTNIHHYYLKLYSIQTSGNNSYKIIITCSSRVHKRFVYTKIEICNVYWIYANQFNMTYCIPKIEFAHGFHGRVTNEKNDWILSHHSITFSAFDIWNSILFCIPRMTFGELKTSVALGIGCDNKLCVEAVGDSNLLSLHGNR